MRSSPSLLYSFKKKGENADAYVISPKRSYFSDIWFIMPIPINNICLSSLIRDQWRRIIVAQIEPK